MLPPEHAAQESAERLVQPCGCIYDPRRYRSKKGRPRGTRPRSGQESSALAHRSPKGLCRTHIACMETCTKDNLAQILNSPLIHVTYLGASPWDCANAAFRLIVWPFFSLGTLNSLFQYFPPCLYCVGLRLKAFCLAGKLARNSTRSLLGGVGKESLRQG